MTVTLHVWRVRTAAIPLAFWGMAVDPRRLRRQPGTRFVKLLGTGKAGEFGARSADLTRWAAIVVADQPVPPPMRSAVARCTLTLRSIASRGTWSGTEPFEPDSRTAPIHGLDPELGAGRDRPIAVITRARLRARHTAAFWRAIDPVARSLHGQDGLLAAFGVGEAPLGFQGTVSVWRRAADIVRFAYRQPEHAAVVARTPRQRWYAEELFARFEVLDVVGDREVIGWKESP